MTTTLGPGGKTQVTTQELYADLRKWLTDNRIPIAHSTENFDALINTFYGREVNGVFAYDLMKSHFDAYRKPDGSIDTQAATDINDYLGTVGVTGAFDAAPSNDSGPYTGVDGPPTATETPKGIMGGGQIQKITRDGDQPLWAVSFQVGGGVTHLYTFDSYDQLTSMLGSNWQQEFKLLDDISMSAVQSRDSNTWLIGSAAAFEGQTGQSYGTWWNNLLYEAALEAGVRNPGPLGDFFKDPDVQRIIAEGSSSAGDWSEARIQAELRNTNYYQNVLYPGIADSFLKTGSATPEQDYMNYLRDVTDGLAELGYPMDADGTYKTQLARMLPMGITVSEFNEFVPTFVRAEQSAEYASVFNQWTQRELGQDITFEDWFSVLDGSSTPELRSVVEKATIQFQAERASTNLSADQISRLADLTQLSEAQLVVAFSEAEKALLGVGQADLERYGLSQEALVNAAFGVETGGRSATDIQRQARKAATELGIQDDQKAQFFVGFDRFSRPQRSGLAASAPEAG